mmetsp:Transcript_12922/g.47262  ORF Transcript_12922/g.47262 Transcript_12922/m.47262 type:complete len:206 (-) Transcript_12922:317-934(-)
MLALLSLSDTPSLVNFQPRSAEYLSYMLKTSFANNAASSPPAPALTSSTTLRSSASSTGRSRVRRRSYNDCDLASTSSNSSDASSCSSCSASPTVPPWWIIVCKSSRSFWFRRYRNAMSFRLSRLLSSFVKAANVAASFPSCESCCVSSSCLASALSTFSSTSRASCASADCTTDETCRATPRRQQAECTSTPGWMAARASLRRA